MASAKYILGVIALLVTTIGFARAADETPEWLLVDVDEAGVLHVEKDIRPR